MNLNSLGHALRVICDLLLLKELLDFAICCMHVACARVEVVLSHKRIELRLELVVLMIRSERVATTLLKREERNLWECSMMFSENSNGCFQILDVLNSSQLFALERLELLVSESCGFS